MKNRCNLLAMVLWAITTLQGMGQSVNTLERAVEQLAPNVYAIRHPDAPDGFPQGNTLVVIGSRDVLVVDACYLPSSAAEDIKQIKKWTDKPVRYLVNTHWHYDHTMGNGTYAQAFPGISIVSHVETQKQIIGYNPGWFERFPKRADTFKQYVDSGKDINGNDLSAEDIEAYKKYIAGIQPVHEEFKKVVDRSPNVAFTEKMTIDLGNLEVQLLHLGRGNTAGDIVIYLPAQGVLAAGDLLDYPVPYLGGGYPSELATTLGRIGQLEWSTLLPGHGEVLKSEAARAHLKNVEGFVSAIVGEVSRQIYLIGNGPRNLDKIREATLQALPIDEWRKKFAGEDKDNISFFDGFSLQGIITAAYAEKWGR